MTSSEQRRKAAFHALELVERGAVAGAVENQLVDFKEETGTVRPGGRRVPIDSRHEPAAVVLAAEVACLANSDSGGALVVGSTTLRPDRGRWSARTWNWTGCVDAFTP